MFVATEKTCEERRAGGLCGPGNNDRGLRVTHNEEETRMEGGRRDTENGITLKPGGIKVQKIRGGQSTRKRERVVDSCEGKKRRGEERRGERVRKRRVWAFLDWQLANGG
jgi:hypothetical protein